MNSYGTHAPPEFNDAKRTPINRVKFEELDHITYQEPLLVEGFESIPFHRFPPKDEVVSFLIDTLGNEKVPMSDASDVTLSQWYSNKNGRYLKDWHINKVARDLGLEPLFVTPPKLDDWLNDYSLCNINEKLDFQFLYWGDRGSSTGYHEDVAGTFSWSYNLRGRKAWSFYTWTLDGTPSVIKCIQQPGELIFVPSGCFHSVENLEDDTISINQNWLNDRNLVEVARRVAADSLEASRRFDMFEIKFTTEAERIEQIEFVTRSNNDINASILLEIIHFQLKKRRFEYSGLKRIQEALMQLQVAPQFALIEAKVSQLSEYIRDIQ